MNQGDPLGGGRIPTNAWHPMSPQNLGPPSDIHGFGNQPLPRSGDGSMPSTPVRMAKIASVLLSIFHEE